MRSAKNPKLTMMAIGKRTVMNISKIWYTFKKELGIRSVKASVGKTRKVFENLSCLTIIPCKLKELILSCFDSQEMFLDHPKSTPLKYYLSPNNLIALSILCKTHSLPSTSNVPNKGGATFFPHVATRIGWNN